MNDDCDCESRVNSQGNIDRSSNRVNLVNRRYQVLCNCILEHFVLRNSELDCRDRNRDKGHALLAIVGLEI